MPISTSSFGDERDNLYNEFQRADGYERETLTFPGLTPAQAENFLKRLGGGVEEKLRRVEGIGWLAEIQPIEGGEMLDVRGTLAIEDNERVIYVKCLVTPQQRLSLLPTSPSSNIGASLTRASICRSITRSA